MGEKDASVQGLFIAVYCYFFTILYFAIKIGSLLTFMHVVYLYKTVLNLPKKTKLVVDI